jgi:hypothetical protein
MRTILKVTLSLISVFVGRTASAETKMTFSCKWENGASAETYRNKKTTFLRLDTSKAPPEVQFGHGKSVEFFGKEDPKFKRKPGQAHRFDCDNTDEPGTYDIFLHVDDALLSGGSSGRVVLDIPQFKEGQPYVNPRTAEKYDAQTDTFFCTSRKLHSGK